MVTPETLPTDALQKFLAGIKAEKWDLDSYQIADILWLWQQQQKDIEPTHLNPPEDNPPPATPSTSSTPPVDKVNRGKKPASGATFAPPPRLPVTLKSEEKETAKTPKRESLPLSVPDTVFLRDTLELGRIVKPLIKKISSANQHQLDIKKTVKNAAELSHKNPHQLTIIPAYKPKKIRSLDAILLVEDWASMIFWKGMVIEIRTWLEQLGAFRDLQVYRMGWNERKKEVEIKPFSQDLSTIQPANLIDSQGERLILFFSDCTSPAWYQGHYNQVLKTWGTYQLVTLLSPFPEHLWNRTALSQGWKIQLQNIIPRCPIQQWKIKEIPELLIMELEDELPTPTPNQEEEELRQKHLNQYVDDHLKSDYFTLPVLCLTPHSLAAWSQVVNGNTKATCAGRLLKINPSESPPLLSQENSPQPEAERAVKLFANTASPSAWKLIQKLAAVPINLPIIRLIQQQLLPNSTFVDVVEILLSGLLETSTKLDFHINPNSLEFDFVAPQIQDILLKHLGKSRAFEVIDVLSDYIAQKLGMSTRSFEALLITNPTALMGKKGASLVRAFATVTAEVFGKLGGEYRQIAAQFQQSSDLLNFEPFTFSAEMPIITFEPEIEEEGEKLQEWEFTTVKVNRRGEIIKTETYTAQYFTEILTPSPLAPLPQGEGREDKEAVTIDMIAIPGGTFRMGSPEGEGYSREKPQHEVTVSPFFMGKYPVTQAQWKAIASRTDLKVEIDLDPDPSYFKRPYQGIDRWQRPVEQVNWYEAVEFCQRLSKLTGRDYRLPSEAQWEYACRAGTTTPFYFGETLTGELANYRASEAYANESKGEYRQQTTPVGQFPPNAFGLYDMHGNVWEWCLDDWHSNYNDAPTDGSAWIDDQPQNSDTQKRSKKGKKDKNKPNNVLRGGSWYFDPDYCRSAIRNFRFPHVTRLINYGFRVVCLFGRT